MTWPPRRMHAAVLDARGHVQVVEMDVPEPGPGEALVRIRACGICSSDLLDWYVAQKARNGPFVFGHEPAGEIVALGPGAAPPPGVGVGTRVFVHHHAPCLACAVCRRGDFVHCPVWRQQGLRPGGMAQYAVVSPQVLRADTLPLPAGMGWTEGVLVEPVACAVRALRRAGFQPGWRVAVLGVGFMGQVLGLLARAWGAASLVAIDVVPFRLRWAQQHWADAVIDAAAGAPSSRGGPDGEGAAAAGDQSQPGSGACAAGGDGAAVQAPGERATAVAEAVRELWAEGADLVVVTPAGQEPLQTGVACCRDGGTVLMFAPVPPGVSLGLPGYQLFFQEIRLIPSYSAGPQDTRDALAVMEGGRLPVDALVTHRYPLDQVEAAYRQVKRAEETLKVMVEL